LIAGQARTGFRKLDGDCQARVGVPGPDLALVQFHGAAGDRQAQAHSSTGAVAVVLDAEERFEQVFKAVVGNGRSMVASRDRATILK
jgi:hypothetical protein